ncbi:MAG: DUF2723 domain-containing protein [Candidatus Hydrogenedentota bacterium]
MIRFSSFFFAALALALFLLTSAPGIGTEDSGELATGARLLAMVHAPGYPLYLLLGRLAAALSLYPGRGLVLLSVVAGAATVGLFHFIVKRELDETSAAIAAVSLIFCRGFWMAATEVEVYTIQSLLLTGLLGSLLQLKNHPGSGKAKRLLGFLTGLTLAHHMGLTILLPAIALFVGCTARGDLRDWSRAAGNGIAGVALYGALPLLSTRAGIAYIAWDPIRSFPQLLNVMGGAGFRKLLFAVPPDQALLNLGHFPFALAIWFPYLSIPLAVAGMWTGYRRMRAFTVLILAWIGITILHAANYNVLDPERFLLPAVVPFAWLSGVGFHHLSRRHVLGVEARVFLVTALLATGMAGRLADGNFFATAYDTMPTDVARAVLRSHESRPESQVIWTDWRFYPTLRYFQLVDGLGRNVLLDFDSTSESPGSVYLPGRTWTMRASPELGSQYALIMDDLQWHVMPKGHAATVPVDPGDPRIDERIGGIRVEQIEWPANVTPGEPIRANITFRRDTMPAADTVTGMLVLRRRGHVRMSTPLSLLHWNTAPQDLDPAKQYSEPVQTIIPTSHADEKDDSFTLELRLTTSLEKRIIPLGRIRLNSGR